MLITQHLTIGQTTYTEGNLLSISFQGEAAANDAVTDVTYVYMYVYINVTHTYTYTVPIHIHSGKKKNFLKVYIFVCFYLLYLKSLLS